MGRLITRIAILALINQRTTERNGHLITTRKFQLDLNDGRTFDIAEGMHVLIGEDQLGIGHLAFENEEEDGLLAFAMKTLGNSQMSNFAYFDWEDIRLIRG